MREDAEPHPATTEVAAQSAAALGAMLDAGELTTVALISQLIERIEAVDVRGPALRSVLELAPDALDIAAERDAERRAGRVRGPLHGVPVLVKDNVDTAAPLHTTAGSLVFGDSAPAADAPLVAALRAAGAIVLGKTNLSEWANFRGRPSSSGWSAAGGQTRNPHALDRSPGGSSAGSGAAVAAGLAPLAVGTETDGSIICPAAACGVAGLKPTVGLVSRTGIVPISWSQDTAGPMARTARDIALLLEAMCRGVDDGEDPAGRSERRPATYQSAFSTLLGDGGLLEVRVGVVRDEHAAGHAATTAVLESALEALATTGARIVDPVPALPGDEELADRELMVLTHEFGIGARAYFERRAAGSPDPAGLPLTLDDVIAHAHAAPAERADLFATDLLEVSARSSDLDAGAYSHALEENRRVARDALDSTLAAYGVDVLVAPAMPPAWPIDHVLGDHLMATAWSAAAVAGYPSATLPMGMVHGLPVGIALLGPAWSEALLLRVMHALERALGPASTMPAPVFAPSTTLRA